MTGDEIKLFGQHWRWFGLGAIGLKQFLTLDEWVRLIEWDRSVMARLSDLGVVSDVPAVGHEWPEDPTEMWESHK